MHRHDMTAVVSPDGYRRECDSRLVQTETRLGVEIRDSHLVQSGPELLFLDLGDQHTVLEKPDRCTEAVRSSLSPPLRRTSHPPAPRAARSRKGQRIGALPGIIGTTSSSTPRSFSRASTVSAGRPALTAPSVSRTIRPGDPPAAKPGKVQRRSQIGRVFGNCHRRTSLLLP